MLVGADTWSLVIYPALGLIAAVIVAAGTTYPIWKDWRAGADTRARRAERLEATADAVLGRDADPNRGRARTVGLLETTAEIRATIGNVNGSGKTVMDLVHANTDELRRVASGQVIMAERMEQHITSDTRQFARLEEDIRHLQDRPK